ncbi:hypothetical protein M378DRAFT_182089 [Amanita muscaria Koide BX008]|uniref:Uncharacterized protein n=1 Tax=Amanita muscaria (strain Koide BX008) TaxID=946122 RepID=A0A0C2SPU4_AMAMK|nr:hypothetical protein M378DRAFT_182089 [Amanita muscaria Koide BX008]
MAHPSMSDILGLVKKTVTLSSALPPSILKGTMKDKIWEVMHGAEGETPFKTFNSRFDALFGEDCRDLSGRLHYIRQGKNGMGTVCSYLKKIKWDDFPLDLVDIKLQRLVSELKHLICRGVNVDEPKGSRQINPASKLCDADNAQPAELSFQRKAIEDFHTNQDQTSASNKNPASNVPEVIELPATPTTSNLQLPVEDLSVASPPRPRKRTASIVIDDEGSPDEEQPRPCTFIIIISLQCLKQRQ